MPDQLEKDRRWQLAPMFFVFVGVAIGCVCAFAARDRLGVLQFGVYAGSAVALLGLFWFRRRLTPDEIELARASIALDEHRIELRNREKELDEARQQAEEQLEEQATRIDSREKELSQKLIAYHQWMEFPAPVDLAQPADMDDQLSELAKKDRQMLKLLDDEVQSLYERIRNNKYSVDGKFQATKARDDAHDLILRVARIYQGDAENPVLETSIAQVLRAASRVCLDFLVVMDQLPLDVKEYNLNNLYAYVRQAVKAYGVYKKAEPYLPFANAAVQVGRFAMGANPISMGAWWFAGALGQKGAKKLASHLVNRHALALLNDLVRVIGFEVASVYSGQFRYRDANWIYAAELTELMSQFPLSQQSLSLALQEVSATQLRNEYDRVYLYRLVAAQKSAKPARYRAAECLTPQERSAVAARLERFMKSAFPDADDRQVGRWKDDVEQRLLVKVKLLADETPRSRASQVEEALNSLAGFLLGVKQRAVGELEQLMADVALMKEVEQHDQLFQKWRDTPPFVFDPPDLDLDSPLVTEYFIELAGLAANVAPHSEESDQAVADAAGYLRKDQQELRTLLDEKYYDYFAARFRDIALAKKFNGAVARSVLCMMDEDDELKFIFSGVTIESPRVPFSADKTWLVGITDRLVAFHVAEHPQLLWRGARQVQLERVLGLLSAQCRLSGGEWLADDSPHAPALRIAGAKLGGYDAFFAQLLEFCHSAESVTVDIQSESSAADE